MEVEDAARERARKLVLEQGEALAAALMSPDLPDRWEPLRDLLLTGLDAGGLRYAVDGEGFRTAVGGLAEIALDARRHGGRTPST